MISFHGLTAPDWVLQGISGGRIAAVCLFAYNVASKEQLRTLTDELHRAASSAGLPPPLIGIDQEGGQVMAVAGGTTELPGNMALGATRSEELAFAAGSVLASELLGLGVNVNFAPVLDLAAHLDSQVVGNRSFGDDPLLAATLGRSLIRGMQRTGVLATAKHFPGHGGTRLDSHRIAPVIERSREELEGNDLLPFRAAIEEGVGAIMSSHVIYPALDPTSVATLSKPILTDLLRHELGFRGLVISDAMDMHAVTDRSAQEQVARAIDAGVDLVLLGHLPHQADVLERLAPSFRHDAKARIAEARDRLPVATGDFSLVGHERHFDVSQRIADAATTLVRGGPALPMRPNPGEAIGVATIRPTRLTPADSTADLRLELPSQVRARHHLVKDVSLPYGATREQIAEALVELRSCAKIIVATIDAGQDESQRELLDGLSDRARSTVHIVTRSPADVHLSPPGAAVVCSYGVRAVNTESAVKVIFGELEPRGVLPVRLEQDRLGNDPVPSAAAPGVAPEGTADVVLPDEGTDIGANRK